MIVLALLLLVALAGPAQAGPQVPAPLPFSPAVVAGDVVYVSGALPIGGDGKVVSGDVRAQTARVLDELGALLEKNGSRLGQAAAVSVYLKNQADFAAMNEVYARYWPKDPPARTTAVVDLVAPGALVEIGMVALRNGVERKVIHPPSWRPSPSPYSYGIQSGETLFLAGLVSRNAAENTDVPGDIKVQTATVMRNAGAVLEAAGMSISDVVSSRVFITDAALFQDMNAVYRTAFAADPPVRATVRTGLTSPQHLVEITMIAVKGGRRRVFTTPGQDGSPGKPNPLLSSAVQQGDTLFLSGMLGATGANKGDAGAQTREALARLGRTLEAAGFAWSDVVDAVVYLPDLGDFAAMNAVYRGAFAGRLPARATVGAGLVSPDGLVEIMLTAVKKK